MFIIGYGGSVRIGPNGVSNITFQYSREFDTASKGYRVTKVNRMTENKSFEIESDHGSMSTDPQ